MTLAAVDVYIRFKDAGEMFVSGVCVINKHLVLLPNPYTKIVYNTSCLETCFYYIVHLRTVSMISLY